MDSPITNPAANSWNFVVKVKHGDTLKRFGAAVYGNSMDLNMMSLRTKIVNLFKLKPDAHLELTYVDDDGDIVALDTDDELYDAAISQHLNPLRINVQLSSTTATEPGLKTYSRKTRNATTQQQTNNLQHITSAVDDALNSIPEPFRGAFSKVYHESLSKAVPAVADIVDLVSKLAACTATKTTTGEPSSTSNRATTPSDINVSMGAERISTGVAIKPDEQVLEQKNDGSISKDKNHMPININTSASELPGNARFSGYPSIDDLLAPSYLSRGPIYQDKGKGSAHDSGKLDIPTASNLIPSEFIAEHRVDLSTPFGSYVTSAGENSKTHHFGTIPNSSRALGDAPQYRGTSSAGPESFLLWDAPPIPYSHKRISGSIHDNMLRTFHKGVRCDGCGMYPIIGVRFKSKVKENYDLCNLCFMEMGSEADYVRIEKSNHTSHKPLKELHKSHLRHRIPISNFHGAGGRSSRGKLESRFIQDVTVLDGTLMAPSTPFTKIWRMRNNGTIRWPYGTQLLWVGGDQFSTQSSVNLGIPLEGYPVEGEIDIAVDFISPSLPGRYVSYWRLASPTGQKFGQRVWVLIQVENSQPDYSSVNWFTGLNLNLPPDNNSQNVSAPIGIMDSHADFFSAVNIKPEPSVKLDELSGSYNNPVQINAQPTSSNAVPHSMPAPVTTKLSYPIVDLAEDLPELPTAADVTSTEVTEADNVEQTLLKELESMGFKQIDLNKEVLRLNDYDLELSVDDLCGYAKWDPLLSELQDMGFSDKEKNKKLLIKHGGSIKLVVMELVAEENA